MVVDNASGDGVVARVREELPSCGSSNVTPTTVSVRGATSASTQLGDVDSVALVNNDARVEPGWLAALARALDAEPRVGAACPDPAGGPLSRGHAALPTARRAGDQPRGVLVSGARIDGSDVGKLAALPSGFLGREAQDDGGANGPARARRSRCRQANVWSSS